MSKTRRHHPDDRIRIFIHANALADDAGVGAKLALPQRVTDHDAIEEARNPLGLPVDPSQRRCRTEELEIIGARAEQLDSLHPIAAGQRGACGYERAELL